MKVHYQDDRVLQLRPRGGWVLLLIGVIVVLLAPLWIWLMGLNTTLSCERVSSGQPPCTLSRAVLGFSVSSRPLEALTGAHVAQSTDSDGDTMYRLMIEAGDQVIPFTSHTSSSYSGKAAAVADVQRYLTDTSVQSLTVRDGGTVGLVVSGIFILIGAGLGIAGVQSLSTLWTFDRDQDAIVRFRRTLFGPNMWQYTLSDIANVAVSTSRDSDGDTTYRVELYTTQGQRIPMTSWYSSGYKSKQSTADAISAFINQP
ncbi:MAG: hypothetical protein MUQ30_00085 [Anaerolineae bacterium]|nr:hypothetical protein [Anaerolineae bacterium]